MNRLMSEHTMSRVLTTVFFILSTVSGVGAVERGVVVRGDDASPADGHEVFGITIGKNGSALAGVRVELSGDGVKQMTVSDAEGAFRIASVPPGSYTTVFKLKGMKKVKLEVTVSTGDVDMGAITME